MRHTIPQQTLLAVINRDQKTCQKCGKQGEYVVRFGKPAVVEDRPGGAGTRRLIGHVVVATRRSPAVTIHHGNKAKAG